MSMDCIFANPPANHLLNYDVGVGECAGNPTSVKGARAIIVPLYGALDSLDLMLIRGGRIVKWNDHEEVSHIESQFVCQHHMSSLLTEWDRNSFGNKFTNKKKQKRLVCSLHNIKHRKDRPMTNRRLFKQDAIDYMLKFGALCHPGTAICDVHAVALSNSNLCKFEFAAHSTMSDMEPLDYSSDDSDDPPYVQPPTPRETTPEPVINKTELLRSALSAYGIKRLFSENPWDTLDEEKKSRKLRALIQFLDELFKISAGEHWELMKMEFKKKINVVAIDPRIESIMDAVGRCIEDCNDKRVRISVLKLLTGAFSEKDIVRGTGASRFLIRQAKLAAFDEMPIAKSFKRERYVKSNVQLLLRFISRSEILVLLPNTCKKYTLSNGCELPIAAVARNYSYREIYKMFGAYCEQLGKMKGLNSRSDLQEFVRANSLGYSTAYKLMETIAPIRSRVDKGRVILTFSENFERSY